VETKQIVTEKEMSSKLSSSSPEFVVVLVQLQGGSVATQSLALVVKLS
jgi:hypothetical protein